MAAAATVSPHRPTSQSVHRSAAAMPLSDRDCISTSRSIAVGASGGIMSSRRTYSSLASRPPGQRQGITNAVLMGNEESHAVDASTRASDTNLLNFALAEMQRDRRKYLAMESTTRRKRSAMADATTTVKPAKLQKREPRDSVLHPRPSLAATHPSLYTVPAKKQQEHHKPPQDAKKPFQDPLFPNVDCSTSTKPAKLPWRVYTDPSYMTSVKPQFDDPRFRMLKIDVQVAKPNVISPAFMIGLPLGTLIEGANDYSDMRD